jgi:hypothetical protein
MEISFLVFLAARRSCNYFVGEREKEKKGELKLLLGKKFGI